MKLDLIIDKPFPARANRFLRALRDTRPAYVNVRLAYNGGDANIMCYGPGRPSRQSYIKKALSEGRHVVMWDLAYWDRRDSMRLAVDHQHPTREQLALATGPARRNFVLREDADPRGPILLVGMGEKSNVQHGLRWLEWEHKAIKAIQQRWPGRRIVYRPKHKLIHIDGALSCAPRTPIEGVLKGCSAVWCRHSNVAVDACIAGVPVYCTDGAAYALYRDNPEPTREQRMDFLRALSWFEWNPNDFREAWKWIGTLLGSA